ncbi:MAG: hypothetical protein FWF08_02560 [Oscillospiraceae bacterium]|nr:hypothetical protein [Oscillospiraceae bacterium]
MNKTKIVFIGAGSLCFGLSMFRDVFTSAGLRGSTLALVDIDGEALDRAYGVACGMNEAAGAGLTVEKTTDRRQALPGAGFVVNAICIERAELWKLDFAIPKAHGVRHTLGENGGPGALFFGLRTIPMILDIVRDMEELCPGAFFLNFSNPESRIILALGRYSKIRAVGLCHGISMAQNAAAKIMGRDSQSISVTGAGLNHFQWLTSIKDAVTGEDLYPVLAECDRAYDPSYQPLTRKMFRAFGLFPTCSDDHMGEYLSFGYEAGEEGYDFERDAANRAKRLEEMESRIKENRFADWLEPSGERAVDVITGVLNDKRQVIPSGVVYNNGAISNLPDDAAVEVSVMADAAGITPLHMGELLPACARVLSQQVMVQQMAVDAAVSGSKEMALQALLLDPTVNSTDAAVRLLDDLWEINRPYIRNCL